MSVQNPARRGLQPTRRSVVHGAAWSVPVVALAATAPAYAASTCSNPRLYMLNWGSSVNTYVHSGNNSYAKVPSSTAGAPDIYVHFATTFQGSGAGDGTIPGSPTAETRNLSVPPVGGTGTTQDPALTGLGGLGAGETGVRLQQVSPKGYANRQDVAVSFRAGTAANSALVNVQGLSFYIVDIDALGPNTEYSDRVTISSTVALSGAKSATILGDGTTATETATTGPWRNNALGNRDENSNLARVQVTSQDDYAARTSTFTLSYWTATGASAPALGQYHRIYMSDFSFRTCP